AYRREQARAEQDAWDVQQARNPEPDTADGDLLSEPTYWARRAARHRAERARADRSGPDRASPDGTRPPIGRWWDRNKPVVSRAEEQVHQLLDEILHPPPF
ncbi:HNH endonuclease, partial [Dietzia sp. B44]|nr:HNH endonuclease [Dietzia sp. B44]